MNSTKKWLASRRSRLYMYVLVLRVTPEKEKSACWVWFTGVVHSKCVILCQCGRRVPVSRNGRPQGQFVQPGTLPAELGALHWQQQRHRALPTQRDVVRDVIQLSQLGLGPENTAPTCKFGPTQAGGGGEQEMQGPFRQLWALNGPAGQEGIWRSGLFGK